MASTGCSLLSGSVPIREAKEGRREVSLYAKAPHPGLLKTRPWASEAIWGSVKGSRDKK